MWGTPRRYSILAAAGLVLVGTLAGVHFARASQSASGAQTASGSRARPMHAAIARVIADEVSVLRSADEVTAYLGKLQARARHRGDVGALEVEPGYAAIARLTTLPAAQREQMSLAFGHRMTVLGQQLRERR